MNYLLQQARWQLKAREPGLNPAEDANASEGWRPASVPGTVQLDLLAQGEIPDPYLGLNEREVQWVGERDWLYRTSFDLPPEALARRHLRLELHGLDTYCTVLLNGREILRSDNMFLPHSLDVREALRPGSNTLALVFESPLRVGRELEARHGQRPAWNGDKSRLYVRKAQYHYGWDWGPVLLAIGPWKDVQLLAFDDRIEDLHVTSEVTPELTAAVITARVALADASAGEEVTIELLDPEGRLIEGRSLAAGPALEASFELSGPRLWYPNGLGAQPLYTISLSLRRDGRIVDERATRVGLRRLRVVQEPVLGEKGASFTFEVNNRPFFVGGANWIPEDLLLNRVGEDRYRERLGQARDAGMTMLRVWGGGIYEQDAFYDLCDELGLLVWQDFMFACGMYPAHADFLVSVRAEAEAAVRRLRNHPSLALWCGNNEDYAIAQSVGAYGPGGDEGRFDAKVIYEELLPAVCAALDPGRFYWPGSPYGGVESSDQTVGDRHTWEVWHGPMVPYQEYERYQGRFVSEFGLQSAPALATIRSFAPEEELFPESRTLTHHNKAAGPNGEPDGHRRLAVYLADNLRAYNDLAEYVYDTQFVQAEAMRHAFRDFRRRFEHPGKHAVSGALVWQLNDCWPVTSWAIVDSQGIEKPAYYAIRRELAPLAIALRRREHGAEFWIHNALVDPRDVEVQRYAYDLTGKLVAEETLTVRALPGRRTDLAAWDLGREAVVLFAEARVGGEVLSRSSDFPQPHKYYALPDPGLRVERVGEKLRLSSAGLAKGVWLDAGRRAGWSDNFIDLRPGETRLLTASTLDGAPISLRYLGAKEALAVETAGH